MPIRILQEGMYDVPVIICDHCGESIDRAADGGYHWRSDVPSDFPGSAVYYAHRRCGPKFERRNKGAWSSIDLDCLPIFLGNNLQIRWEKAREKADVAAGLS